MAQVQLFEKSIETGKSVLPACAAEGGDAGLASPKRDKSGPSMHQVPNLRVVISRQVLVENMGEHVGAVLQPVIVNASTGLPSVVVWCTFDLPVLPARLATPSSAVRAKC